MVMNTALHFDNDESGAILSNNIELMFSLSPIHLDKEESVSFKVACCSRFAPARGLYERVMAKPSYTTTERALESETNSRTPPNVFL
jgi:hypothetical protein